MPKNLEKVRKDIMNGNPSMSKDMAYALATNIIKQRKKMGTTRSLNSVKNSAGYKAYEKTEKRDNEASESYAEKVREMKRGMR